MATMTGANLLASIIESTGVEVNALISATLTAKLQQMIDNGTYSKLAASIAMSAFSTVINDATEINALSDAIEANAALIADAAEGEVDQIVFPPIGGEVVEPVTFTLSAGADSINEGAANTFTVEASRAVDEDTVVTFQLKIDADGDTAQLADFNAGAFNAKSVTILAGETTATFDVTAITNDGTEVSEKYTVEATVGGETLAKQVTILDGSAGAGQTFVLTSALDVIPGMNGSNGNTVTSGNDTIVGSVDAGGTTTMNVTDQIDAGEGTDTLKIIVGTNLTDSIMPNIENVEIFEINGAGTATIDLDTSAQEGLDSLLVTAAGGAVDLTGADTTDISVSGAKDAITVDGGLDVTVTDKTAGKNIAIGLTTASAGTVTVTDSNQGTGNIAIDGGTDVTVVASSKVATGTIVIGSAAADAATGAVSVTQNLTSEGEALDNSAGTIDIIGGTNVDVTINGTITADEDAESNSLTAGAVTVTSDGNTTDVNVVQNLTANDYSKDAIDDVPATQVLTFDDLALGETVIVDGLTFTASMALDAEDVAAAFANLGVDSGAGATPSAGDIVSAGGPVTNGSFTGATSGDWTSVAADGANVTFTAALGTPAMTVDTGDVTPASDYDAGTDNSGTAESGDASVAYGVVVIDEDGTADASIENITVDGYGDSTIGDTNAVDALETLSLANSAGTMTVTTAAASLELTVDDVDDTVTLTAASLLDLTLNAVGGDSDFALVSADTTDLTIDATADLDLTGSTFTALVDVAIAGAGAVILDGQVAATLETLDASDNTGGVTASVNGDATEVTGGDGDDEITVLNADTAIDQEIALGAGDDTVDISNGGTVTAIAPTSTIDGGDDTDLLVMDSVAAAGANAAFAAHFTNFEQLEIAEQVDISAGDVTVDLSVLDYDYVVTNGTESGAVATSDGTFANALIFENVANGSTFELNKAQIATGAVGSDIGSIKISLDDATGETDSLNLITAADAGLVEAQGVETINVTGKDSVTLMDTDLITVTVNGNDVATTDSDGNPLTYSAISVVLDATSTNVELVDASDSMGAFTFDSLDDTTATVIKGGEGDDEISVSGQNDDVYAGAGNDTITIAATASASMVEGGDGNDLFDITSATLGKEAYATITDFESGDQIEVNAASFEAQGVVVTDPDEMTLTDWFTAAFNQTDAGEAIWFQHNGNTYIVDNVNTDDFVAGDDVIVKLTGLVDLDTASFNDSGIIEMA